MSIRKLVLTIILIGASVRLGWELITSEKFQQYGDTHKSQWTCPINIFLGSFCEIMSDYRGAIRFYDRISNRCPNSSSEATALFQKAACYESIYLLNDALAVYMLYVEKYPQGEKVSLANKNIDRIKNR